ncbi:hypothetical protein D3C81_1653240 [compost metagenome]
MISLMMRLAVASFSAPSRPYPTSMRRLRSSLATISKAPSSTFLRPSLHCSTTRRAYCSIGSSPVVGTINTASWLPFSFSNACSFPSRAAACAGVSVADWSVTLALRGGTATG